MIGLAGADVTHSRSFDASEPSVAAVVASQDKTCTHFAAQVRMQGHRVEMIQACSPELDCYGDHEAASELASDFFLIAAGPEGHREAAHPELLQGRHEAQAREADLLPRRRERGAVQRGPALRDSAGTFSLLLHPGWLRGRMGKLMFFGSAAHGSLPRARRGLRGGLLPADHLRRCAEAPQHALLPSSRGPAVR